MAAAAAAQRREWQGGGGCIAARVAGLALRRKTRHGGHGRWVAEQAKHHEAAPLWDKVNQGVPQAPEHKARGGRTVSDREDTGRIGPRRPRNSARFDVSDPIPAAIPSRHY